MRIEPERLAAEVQTLAVQHRLQGIKLAIFDHGRRHFISGSQEDLVEAGCLSKLLTSSLFAEAVRERRISWDYACELMVERSCVTADYVSITPRELINHTHGLEMVREGRPGLRDDGRLDWDKLCGNLRMAAYRECGSYYSYDHIGAWCLAAILEQIYDCAFIDVLRARGLGRYAKFSATTAHSVCASAGQCLKLRMDEWLNFAEYGMGPSNDPCFKDEPVVPLPGWHPTERGIRLGWKSYGEDWFGHLSNMPNTSTYLRISPTRKCAIVLSAPGKFAGYFALARLFGRMLPEFVGSRAPRLKREVLPDDEARQFVGTYTRSENQIEISLKTPGALEMVVLDDRGSSTRYALRAAECGLFVVEKGAGTEFTFVQFLETTIKGNRRLLWNGRQLWFRAA